MNPWQAGAMRTRRWLTTLAAGGIAVGLLSGCTEKDGRVSPTAVDLARAQAVWADPWLAPSDATTVSPNGPAPGVRREVAGRSYSTAADPRDVIATEVRAALATGWQLVGTECAPDEQGVKGDARAFLARGSSPDDSRIAVLAGSVTSATTQVTEVGITVLVPHHLDTPWPAPSPTPIDTSCLVTGPPSDGTPEGREPYNPDDLVLKGDGVKPPSWSDDDTGQVQAALTAIRDDRGITSLGMTLVEPSRGKDDLARDSAGSEASTQLQQADLAATVTSLTSKGWTLTYAGCLGPGAPNVAELSRPAASRTAVLRLSQVAGSTIGPRLAASVVISTPGFSPDPPAAISAPCFGDQAAPKTFSHKGIPSLGPTRMFPLQR